MWLFVAAQKIAFFWSAAVAIYLLLRRDVDESEMDEVYLGPKSGEFGLPHLEPHATGVPGVADAPVSDD